MKVRYEILWRGNETAYIPFKSKKAAQKEASEMNKLYVGENPYTVVASKQIGARPWQYPIKVSASKRVRKHKKKKRR